METEHVGRGEVMKENCRIKTINTELINGTSHGLIDRDILLTCSYMYNHRTLYFDVLVFVFTILLGMIFLGNWGNIVVSFLPIHCTYLY